jgi:succinate dehydrogenase/fumarate reductase flavoprotein subunit
MTIAEEIQNEDLPLSEMLENADYVATSIVTNFESTGDNIDRMYTFSDDSRMTVIIATSRGPRKGIMR